MTDQTGVLSVVLRWLQIPLIRLGQNTLTVESALTFLILTAALIYGSRWLQRLLIDRVLARRNMQIGVRQSIGTMIRYALVAVGFLVILQMSGIDLTTLNVVAGAVGIGVGFGLQNIAGNVVSGIIILFERPVKVGDRIEVGGIAGTVTEIRARSTTVVTNDSIAIIIPNSRILSDNVVNWSYSGDMVRFRTPIGVAYDSDVRQVERLLLEVASENPGVLASPAPSVRLVGFGDSTLDFQLLTWTSTQTHRKGLLTSALNFAILEKFADHGIRIPHPRRDVYVQLPTDSLAADRGGR